MFPTFSKSKSTLTVSVFEGTTWVLTCIGKVTSNFKELDDISTNI